MRNVRKSDQCGSREGGGREVVSLGMLCFEDREFAERWYIGGEKNIGFEKSYESFF